MSNANEARPEPIFDWFLPIDGDGEHIGTLRAEREPSFANLRDIALAAESAGYRSVLVPTRLANGSFEELAPLAETWTAVAAVAPQTTRLRFLVAHRPGTITTALFAKMIATLDQFTAGRIDVNIVPGGIEGDMERSGESAGHDDRYGRAIELTEACRRLWAGGRVSFEGDFVRLKDAVCAPGPFGRTPAVYTGGASAAALRLAAEQSDVFLAWIQPREETAALVERARAAFVGAGREPRLGLRTHIVLGATEAEAWRNAEELVGRADPVVEAQRRPAGAATMVGRAAQVREAADYRLSERLWNGISRVRVNLGTAIVGTAEQVADELAAYWRLGFDEFVLSAYPHREGAALVAREVLPLVREMASSH